MYTLEEKIALIESSNSFLELNKDIMPNAHKENYYFVSYSHKDYKKVMKDILLLEDQGINIWYDSAMHIGENWEDIAEMYISKFQCKGVIFYLSENSILSSACNKEVAYVLENDKQFFSINIPLEGDDNAVSGLSALLKLRERGHDVFDELLANFEKAFSDKMLYLSYNDSIDRKKEQIEKLTGEDMFLFGYEYNLSYHLDSSVLTECRENSLIRLSFKNNYQVNDELSEKYGKLFPLMRIDRCIFANHYKLQEVTLPDRMLDIGEYAFVNCFKLKKINLDMPLENIRNFAFGKCKSLKVDFVDCKFMGKYAFYECDSLDAIALKCNEIGAFAFSNCKNLKRVDFLKSPIKLDSYCFSGCNSLSEISFLNEEINVINVKGGKLELGDSCFAETALSEITLKGKIDLSGANSLFSDCKELKKVTFDIKNLKALKSYAFTRCYALADVVGLEGVTIYESFCFSGCESLKNLNLQNAKEIHEQAFAGTGLEEVCLQNVTRIQSYAFQGMENLTKLTIGKKIKQIDSCAVYGCNSLKELEILGEDFYFDSDSFDCISPEVITVCNLELLGYLLESCGDKLKIVYLLSGLADEDDLTGLTYELVKTDSDKIGFDKFTVDSSNPYAVYKNKRVVINLTCGEMVYTYCEEVGFDEKKGEYFIVAGSKYYQSEILSISIAYSF